MVDFAKLFPGDEGLKEFVKNVPDEKKFRVLMGVIQQASNQLGCTRKDLVLALQMTLMEQTALLAEELICHKLLEMEKEYGSEDTSTTTEEEE